MEEFSFSDRISVNQHAPHSSALTHLFIAAISMPIRRWNVSVILVKGSPWKCCSTFLRLQKATISKLQLRCYWMKFWIKTIYQYWWINSQTVAIRIFWFKRNSLERWAVSLYIPCRNPLIVRLAMGLHLAIKGFHCKIVGRWTKGLFIWERASPLTKLAR